MPYAAQRSSSSRVVGFGVVLVLHVALIYGLVVTLAHRSIDIVPVPIETKIITAPQQQPIEPPPPPPSFVAPPQVFVPPPEVNIAKPPPPPRTKHGTGGRYDGAAAGTRTDSAGDGAAAYRSRA